MNCPCCTPWNQLDICEERKFPTNFTKHFVRHSVLRYASFGLSCERTFSYTHCKQKIALRYVFWGALLGYCDVRTFSCTHRTKRVVLLCEFWDACSVLRVEWTFCDIHCKRKVVVQCVSLDAHLSHWAGKNFSSHFARKWSFSTVYFEMPV
jgi:hypothetical protein